MVHEGSDEYLGMNKIFENFIECFIGIKYCFYEIFREIRSKVLSRFLLLFFAAKFCPPLAIKYFSPSEVRAQAVAT